jgi:hypothetical protein
MSKPYFITTTERPAEKETIIGNDVLSVKTISNTTTTEKEQLERNSGIDIKSDYDLKKAKEKILKDSARKPPTLMGTDDKTAIIHAPDEHKETIESLEEYLDLGEKAKELCKVPNFSCPWFDTSKLKDKLNLMKYVDQASDLLKSAFATVNEGVFGNIIRCGTYYLTSGLKAIGNVATTVATLGNYKMFEHLGNGIKDNTASTAEGMLPDTNNLFIKTTSNAKTKTLSIAAIIGLATAISIKPKNLFSPFKSSKKSKYPSNKGVISTKRTNSMSSPSTSVEGMEDIFNKYKESELDQERSNIIAEGLSKYEESYSKYYPLIKISNSDGELVSLLSKDGELLASKKDGVWIYIKDENDNNLIDTYDDNTPVLDNEYLSGLTDEQIKMVSGLNISINNGNNPEVVTDDDIDSMIDDDPNILNMDSTNIPPIVTIKKNNIVNNTTIDKKLLSSTNALKSIAENNDPDGIQDLLDTINDAYDKTIWYMGEKSRPVEKNVVLSTNDMMISLRIPNKKRTSNFNRMTINDRGIAINKHYRNQYNTIKNNF